MAKHRAQRPTLPRITGHLKSHAPADLTPPAVAFRAPDYERVLGHENPFPADHRLHTEWETRRRAAASEAAQLRARLLAQPAWSWSDVLERHLAWWTGLFDIRAAALMLPMPPSAYAEMLSDHAEAILSTLRRQRLPIGEELVATMTERMAQRHAHWMVKAHAADQLLRARSSTPGADASASTNVFRRGLDGRWEIRYDGDGKAGLPHVEGFEVIRRLLESPHAFIKATELRGINPADVSTGAAVIDPTARRDYESGLRQIGDERKKARDAGDSAREAELDEQAEQIGEMLHASTGLRGTRRLGDVVEKARKAVSRNYETAMKKIAQELPTLHEHLLTAIHSGRSFTYQPDADVLWETRPPPRPANLSRT